MQNPIQFFHMLQPDSQDVALVLQSARNFANAVGRSQQIIDSILEMLGADQPVQIENPDDNASDN